MTSDGGPWGRRTPEPEPPVQPARAPARARLQVAWPVVVLVAGIGGLVLALTKAFPEAMQTGQDWTGVAYYAGFAVLVAAGAWRLRSFGPTQILRHAGIWAAIVAVLALGFAYRAEISAIPQRLSLAFNTGRPVVVGPHELAISQDDQGGFEVVGKVNGQPVRFMVDTGATDTVLTPQDARRLGVDTAALRFDQQAETANGKGLGAAYVAQSLEVGPIRLANFKMSINQAPMSRSLLGLSFLNRLDSFAVRGRTLYLKWGG